MDFLPQSPWSCGKPPSGYKFFPLFSQMSIFHPAHSLYFCTPRAIQSPCSSSKTPLQPPGFILSYSTAAAFFSFCLCRPLHISTISSKVGSRTPAVKQALTSAGSFLHLHYRPLRGHFWVLRRLLNIFVTSFSSCLKPLVALLQNLSSSRPGRPHLTLPPPLVAQVAHPPLLLQSTPCSHPNRALLLHTSRSLRGQLDNHTTCILMPTPII